MGYEVDAASEEMIPYLVYFGNERIGPRIVDVDGFIIKFERIEGYRLDKFLYETNDTSVLSKIYEEMGRHVGKISKLRVSHGDLRPDNVIVEKRRLHPFIIDWESSMHLGFIFDNPEKRLEFWSGENGGFLFYTKEILEGDGRLNDYSVLESVYSENFREELLKPLEGGLIREIFEYMTY